jgi:hypothetical protein
MPTPEPLNPPASPHQLSALRNLTVTQNPPKKHQALDRVCIAPIPGATTPSPARQRATKRRQHPHTKHEQAGLAQLGERQTEVTLQFLHNLKVMCSIHINRKVSNIFAARKLRLLLFLVKNSYYLMMGRGVVGYR